MVRLGYSDKGSGHNAINLELHEIAHAIDRVVFSDISKTEWFKIPFISEHSSFLPDEYFYNVEEYFAECFAYYYFSEESRQQLESGAPLTYKYIKELIDDILNESDMP